MRHVLFTILMLIATLPAWSDVILYTSPTCRYCTPAKQWLQSRGIQFREIMDLRGQVPRLVVDGEQIVGYHPGQYERLLSADQHKANDYRLSAVRVKNGGVLGSGVLITPGPNSLGLTCAHVFASGKPASFDVFFATGQMVTGKVLAVDRDRDLALFELVEAVRIPAWSVVPQRPKNAVIEGVGFPRGNGPKLRSLEFVGSAKTAANEGGHLYWRFKVRSYPPIEGGDSGGPIFQGGEVIALTTNKSSEGHGYGPSLPEIHQFLTTNADWFRRFRNLPDNPYPWLQPNFKAPQPSQQDERAQPPQVDYQTILDLMASDPRFTPRDGIDGQPGRDGIDGVDGQTPDNDKLMGLIGQVMPRDLATTSYVQRGLAGIAAAMLGGGGIGALVMRWYVRRKLSKLRVKFPSWIIDRLGSGESGDSRDLRVAPSPPQPQHPTATFRSQAGVIPLHTKEIETHQQFVEVPVGNRELIALTEAMNRMESSYPGSRGTIEAIRSLKRQIQSGQS